jgi:hypothetical protein
MSFYCTVVSHVVSKYIPYIEEKEIINLHLDIEPRVTTHEQILQGAKSLSSSLYK